MTSLERRAAYTLAAIFGLRMLGLFMILPVFALYAEHLGGVTPTLVGVAIGAYGLSQSVLGIPFGMASDRVGRKPVIISGLLIFAVGSVVAALSTTIHGVIAGRALQGAGAIAAVVMATLADLTREEQRTKAMAVIGMTIGVSFMVAMVGGPVLNHWVGVPGIFWLTALFALLAIPVVLLLVPTPKTTRLHRDTEPVLSQFGAVLRNAELLRLNLGIMALHVGLTATFTALPLVLRDAGLLPAHHWQLYLPVMVLGMATAIPFIVVAEKKRLLKQIFLGAIALMALSEAGLLMLYRHIDAIVVLVGAYFIAFNLLEATLPSLVTKFAPAEGKGTAMGLYSSSQFIGAFLGGWAGGAFHEAYGFGGVFAFAAAVLLLWLVVASAMGQPRYLASQLIYVGTMAADQARLAESAIAGVRGVAEVTIDGEEGVAYLKVDNHALDRLALAQFATPRP
ncbi:MAG TPA: MFS transporter [Gammaproteobacteria bacterium]